LFGLTGELFPCLFEALEEYTGAVRMVASLDRLPVQTGYNSVERIVMAFLQQKFRQVDGPTWLVAIVLYAAWILLVWYSGRLPWWVIMPVGAYLIAWHFSLQHEAIHAFRGVPAWLRFAVVFPPLGLWFPYPLYRKSHSTHHRDVNLTIPGVDTESYYVSQADWGRMGPIRRALLTVNQTMAGRLLIGPALRLSILVSKETRRVRQGDFSHLPHWAVHAVAVAGLFWFISGVCGFPWWQYCLLIAYPGLGLGLLRAFTEHRAAADSQERTAAVESNVIFGLLYLYNNLHVAHHLKPTMPWYDIPRFYRENRRELLAGNGNFVFKGYAQLARRYLLVPVFSPVFPDFPESSPPR
jgi:fatty acid desaturase